MTKNHRLEVTWIGKEIGAKLELCSLLATDNDDSMTFYCDALVGDAAGYRDAYPRRHT